MTSDILAVEDYAFGSSMIRATRFRCREVSNSTATFAGPFFSRGNSNYLLTGFEQYLRRDWDGDGAEAISPATLHAAEDVLNQTESFETPVVAPGADGTIGLEWHHGDATLYMDIGPTTEIRTYLVGTNAEAKEELIRWGDARLKLHLFKLLSQLYQQPVDPGGFWNVFSGNASSASQGSATASVPTMEIFGFERLPIRDTTQRESSITA